MVLLILVLYPDICPNLFKIEITAGIDLEGPEIYINTSSANNEALCSVPPLKILLYSTDECKFPVKRGELM